MLKAARCQARYYLELDASTTLGSSRSAIDDTPNYPFFPRLFLSTTLDNLVHEVLLLGEMTYYGCPSAGTPISETNYRLKVCILPITDVRRHFYVSARD